MDDLIHELEYLAQCTKERRYGPSDSFDAGAFWEAFREMADTMLLRVPDPGPDVK